MEEAHEEGLRRLPEPDPPRGRGAPEVTLVIRGGRCQRPAGNVGTATVPGLPTLPSDTRALGRKAQEALKPLFLGKSF